MPENNELSERELEILYLVATGASNKEIASKLYISTNTVKVHLKNIFAKIEVTSRTEAAMYAVNAGLLAPGSEGQFVGQTSVGESGQFGEPDGDATITPIRPHWTQRWFWILVVAVIVLAGLGFILRAFIPGQVSGQQSTLPAAVGSLPRWQSKTPMPTSRFGLGVVAYDGLIYAIAGETDEGVSNRVERYDPDTDGWIGLPEKPTAVSEVSAAVVGGKIYIPGGVLSSGKVTDELEIFNPSDGTWERGASLPIPLSGYALASHEGKLYIFGGWDGTQVVSSVYEYNPDQDRWFEKSPMPTARAFAGAAEAIGRIYVIGGEDGENTLSVNEVYQPDLEGSDKAWTLAAAMPTPRSRMGVAGVADMIHVIGGQQGIGEFTSLGYIPENDVWQPIEAFEEIGSQLGVAGLGEFLYVIGGKIDDHPVDNTLAYRAIYTVSIPVIINNQP